MLNGWAEDLSEAEADSMLRSFAWEVRKRKLDLPAILAVEAHRPFSYLGGQATFFFAPFLVPIFGYARVRDYARLLNRRDSVDRLLQYLEGPIEVLKPDSTEPEPC